jgi:hypothetical protein
VLGNRLGLQNSPPRTPLCGGRGTHLPAQGDPITGRLWVQQFWHPSVIHRKVCNAAYTQCMGKQQIRPDADRPSPSAHFAHVADCRKTRCSNAQLGFTVIGTIGGHDRKRPDAGADPQLTCTDPASAAQLYMLAHDPLPG